MDKTREEAEKCWTQNQKSTRLCWQGKSGTWKRRWGKAVPSDEPTVNIQDYEVSSLLLEAVWINIGDARTQAYVYEPPEK